MAIINYDDNPSGFKNAWLNENNPKGILIKFPKYYKKVIPSSNPYSEGLYEHNDRKKKYVFTTDTTIVDNKRYFQLIEDENNILKYTDEDIEDDSFSIKKNIQNGDNVDFIGCISSTLEFKVANDFLYLIDQEINVTLITIEGDTEWHIKVFTGYVDEIKRDKSRDLVRTITCHDFMYRLLDNYDVTDWYVWQYGDGDFEGSDTLKHSIYDLRNSFWNYIANSGTEWSPNGVAIEKRNTGWDQVQDASLINDNIWIPKTLNVSPIDFNDEISGELVGGPFKRNPKEKTESEATQYDIYENGIIQGWDVSDLVARKQIIDLGAVGTLFTYIYNGETKTDVFFREYLGHCNTIYEKTKEKKSGIQATIKIPREEQEKVRETQITAATVLQAFCQFNGVFGQVNGDGKFEYIKLNTSDPFEILEDYQIDVGFSDIEMPKITGVVIFDKTSEEYSSDQIHTDYGDVKNGKKGSALAYYPDDRTKIEGEDAHVYTMDDNFLMNSFEQTDAINVAKNLYNQISNITMVNSDIEIHAMPWLKCGEAICYYSASEDTLFPSEDLYPSENLFPSGEKKIISIIMEYDISGTGLLKGKISCKVENLSSSIVSLNEVISNEMFQRKIGDNSVYSSITQTAERIELKVVDEINNVRSSITQLANEIELKIDGPNGIITRLDLNEEGINALGRRITAEAERIDLIASRELDIKTRLLKVEADEMLLQATKVTFEDLKNGGKTIINGANIQTGTLSADRIKLGSITVDGETHEVNWRKLEHIIQGYPQGAFEYMQSAAIFKTAVKNYLGTSITYVGPNGDPQTITVLTPDDLICQTPSTTPYGGCLMGIGAPSAPQLLVGAKRIKTGAILMAEVEEEV